MEVEKNSRNEKLFISISRTNLKKYRYTPMKSKWANMTIGPFDFRVSKRVSKPAIRKPELKSITMFLVDLFLNAKSLWHITFK